MRKFRRLIYIILGIALLILAAVCLLMLNTIGFSYPPSDMLAREYLDSVVKRDPQAAANLAGDAYCREDTAGQALNDIRRYGSAEIRSVQITVGGSGGSS